MTTKIGLGDLESTDQRGRVGAAEDIELIDRMRNPQQSLRRNSIRRPFQRRKRRKYLAGVGDSLAPVVIRACHILELIYKKILPLDMTVKKNHLNVDEIKPDVYSFLGVNQSRVLICKDTINQKLKAESRGALKDSRTMTRGSRKMSASRLQINISKTELQPTQTKHKKVLSILSEGA
ncbi:hypothetical protein PPACK8108_LOCUS23134 [Phakopsora pachyrhizi]|uniref:Uncharacterized protein n=1 Tax=Phakopsora pachyrhizi TaxID=170000 RepID=A0AAV0BLM1_PHAPC|nr:hypothetical protein PPACK8108_LOCUS23134 [Phakopsora pachyrhizi]